MVMKMIMGTKDQMLEVRSWKKKKNNRRGEKELKDDTRSCEMLNKSSESDRLLLLLKEGKLNRYICSITHQHPPLFNCNYRVLFPVCK